MGNSPTGPLARVPVGSRRRILVVGWLAPLAGSLLLCALGSIWPIRLDYRALQDLHKLEGLDLPQSSGNFSFFSRDNGIESARTATFALRQLAFPDGSVFWATLKENSTGPWTSGFAGVDSSGNVYAVTGADEGGVRWLPPTPVSPVVEQRIKSSRIVFDSEATRDTFEQRWPFLKGSERAAVMSDAPVSSVVRRRISSEITLGRVARIAAVLGSWGAGFLVLLQLPLARRAGVWTALGAALFLALGLDIWLSYLLQWIATGLVHWVPVIAWALLLILAAALPKRVPNEEAREPSSAGAQPPSRTTRVVVVCGLALYALLFLTRLDFDGDFFTNWLPQARFHYLLSAHDPAAILGQGLTHSATYPPGYGIVLSTTMWMVGMNPVESFLPGYESSFAILIYRLLIFALNASLLLLLATYLRREGYGRSEVWMSALLITMLLIPTTAGRHIAAETVLFPMLAASMLLIAGGQRFRCPGMTALGLGIGGAATLVKWEAGIIFLVAVLPWLSLGFSESSPRFSRRVRLRWLVALVVGVAPTLIWRATLRVRNEFFAPVTWSRLTSSLHILPGLAVSTTRLLLDDGGLILLLFGLPLALVYQLRRKAHWALTAVPVCILALFVGWVVVLLFSNVPPHHYVETSYYRLVMVPTFGAILYCSDALLDWKAEATTPSRLPSCVITSAI